MKNYIGVKMIKAEPMKLNGQDGYLVVDENINSNECVNGLSRDLLHELFDYKDGNLYWNNAPRGFRGDVDKPAGTIDKMTGYRKISINNKHYYAHRLVYLYNFGNVLAAFEIDHINRNREDNRIENLRLVTRQENAFNLGGSNGVSYDKSRSKWTAYIDLDGERIQLGRFDLEEDARNAREAAKEKYHVIEDKTNTFWSPKEVFEKAYFQLERDNTVTQLDVDGFVAHTESHLIGEKTTVVQATLKNGFTITESSSCVDPANFDMGIGRDICMEHIKDKVWNHLGFLLQCGMFGFKGGV